MFVVIDTNVLVSALYSRDGSPARVIALVQNGVAISCHDHRILLEYREVLARPRFNFDAWEIAGLLAQIESDGLAVSPRPLNINLPDEQDRKFYEVAKHCNARLITGNLRHFPKDETVVSVKKFLDNLS
jgi:putative PIN family toxin of toxin-antitoxin system